MRRLQGFDYAKPFFYMVTLKKLKGLPAFSQIAADDAAAIRRRLGLAPEAELPTAAAPYLAESAVTRLFVDVIKTFHEQWHCVEPITCFSVMPDHIHLLIKLRGERRKRLPVIVWQLSKRDYAEFSGNAGDWRRTRNFDRFGVPTPRRIRRSAQLEPVEVADKHIKARRFSL